MDCQIRKELNLCSDDGVKAIYVEVWKLKLESKMSYREIQYELRISPNTISHAIKEFKSSYPKLSHLI